MIKQPPTTDGPENTTTGWFRSPAVWASLSRTSPGTSMRPTTRSSSGPAQRRGDRPPPGRAASVAASGQPAGARGRGEGPRHHGEASSPDSSGRRQSSIFTRPL